MKIPPGIVHGPGEAGLVSVVIPTYNRAHVLGRAIESALQQTYASVEVIIADDGSTDDTEGLVRSYGSRVRYYRQENRGVSSARNLGLRHTRGEFVALLDSDDAWLPWKAEAQLAVLRRFPTAGMVWTDMTALDWEGKLRQERYLRTMYATYQTVHLEEVATPGGVLKDAWSDAPESVATAPMYSGDLFAYMLMGSLVHTSTVLLRRSRLMRVGGFDESFSPSGEDYEFHTRTTWHGPVAFLDWPSVLYRIGAADQLTAPRYGATIARNALRTVNRWMADGGARAQLPSGWMEQRMSDLHLWVGEAELQEGNDAKARAHLWQSLWIRRRRRAALLLASTFAPEGMRTAIRRVRSARRKSRAVHAASRDTENPC
jgi:glycosyltransferase involved in cell wall biosynthesis